MKKTITIILIITMLSGLFSACNQQNSAQTAPTVTEENIPTTESVAETNASTEPTSHNLTHYDVINWLNTYADQYNLNHISDLETKQAEEPGVINYSFSFLDGQIHINVQETNGITNSILAYAFPFSLSNVSSQEEAIQICTGLVTLPVLPCDSGFDAQSGPTWHAKQIATTAQITDDSSIISEYARGDWKYSLLVNSITVMMTAIKQNGNSHISTDIFDNAGSSGSTESGLSLSNYLDLSKVWKVDFTAEGVSGTFHYAFSEDGTCYVVLSDGNWPWGGGKGTYCINGNSLEISIVVDGCLFEYSYDFDPQTCMLTHTSGTPIFAGLAKTGDKYPLEEDDANEVSKIQQMAQSFIDNYVDDEGI